MRAFASRVIDARNTVEGKILSVLLSVLLAASLFNVAIFVNKANADEEEFIETLSEQLADVEETPEEAPGVSNNDGDTVDGYVPEGQPEEQPGPAPIMTLGLGNPTPVAEGVDELPKDIKDIVAELQEEYGIKDMDVAEATINSDNPSLYLKDVGAQAGGAGHYFIPVEGENLIHDDFKVTIANSNSADATLSANNLYGNGVIILLNYTKSGKVVQIIVITVALPEQVFEYCDVIYDLNGGTTTSTQTVFNDCKKGSPTPKIENPTRLGYEFDGWSPEVTEDVSKDMTYVAQWKGVPTPITPLNNVRYIVKWIADNGTELKSDIRNDEVGAEVSVAPADKAPITADGTHYVFDANNENNVLSGELKTITSDDDIITLKLYFTEDVLGGDEPGKGDDVPDKYQTTITYKVVKGTWNDGTSADKTAVITLKELKDGKWVDAESIDMKTPANMIPATGYGNGSWDNDPSMAQPKEGSFDPNIFTYTFQPNTNTTYKVEHYIQNIADDGYTLAETESFAGITDTEASASAKEYKGFILNRDAAGTVESGTIAGDGSLVLKLYYNRGSYKVTYKYEGTVPEGAPELPVSSDHKFGSNVTVASAASLPGYTFSGWMRDGKMVSGSTITMPDGPVVLNGSWTPDAGTAYKVEYYTQDINGGTYTLAGTVAKEGTTGATVSAEELTFEGFTLNKKAAGTVESGTIAGDGSLVLKLYYDRNSFKVTYKYATNPEGASALPEKATYKLGADVAIAPMATAPGYTFNGWMWGDKAVAGTINMPNADVEIVGSWTINNYAWRIDRYIGQNPVQTIYSSEAPYKRVIELKDVKAIGDYSRIDTESASYVLTNTQNDGMTIGTNKQNNVITLYYELDNNKDNIPDKYQVTFTYETEDPAKGTVTDDESGSVIDVRTLGNDIKNLTSDTITPGVPESVNLQAKDGYTFDGWDYDPYAERTVYGFQKITFKATWTDDKIGTGQNPNEGDGVADKYQVAFNYVADANGTIQGITKKVVTLGTDEKPLDSANVVAGTAGVIPTPDEGYRFTNVWTGVDNEGNACPAPTVSFLVKGGSEYTFTASFEAIPAPVVPAPTTPVPPVVPGPGAPAGPIVPAGVVPGVAAPAPAPEEITDDATPMAQNPEGEEEEGEEEIIDDENPLGAFDVKHCWTHWMMLMGMLLTAAYGIAVARRRSSFAKDIDDFEKSVTGETAKKRGTVTVRTGSHQAI